MYARSSSYYDALYRAIGKDYAVEAKRVAEIIDERGPKGATSILDVACGTGAHIEHLRERFSCEGVDADRSMVALAAERVPGVPLHCSDMIGLNLNRTFDAVICLFSSIGYLPNVGRLDQVLRDFARHLKPGGIAIVEPWLWPSQWEDGRVDARFVDEPNLKVARMSVSRRDGNVSILNYHFMIAQSDGIRSFTEPHRLTLFTDEEYRRAFAQAGLELQYDPEGLSGRGLYIGTKR